MCHFFHILNFPAGLCGPIGNSSLARFGPQAKVCASHPEPWSDVKPYPVYTATNKHVCRYTTSHDTIRRDCDKCSNVFVTERTFALQTFESQNNTKSSSTHKEHCAFTSSDSFPSVLRHCWLGASCRHSSARVREHGGPCKMFPSPSLVTVQNLVTAAKNSVLQVSLNGASLYLTLPYLTIRGRRFTA